MVDTIRKSLRDSFAARWTALLLVSFTMLCGYYVADVLAPLKPMIEQQLKWTSSQYGMVTGAYGWFNVFFGMLVFGGIILDKMGARFTGILSSILMVVGCFAKWFALNTHSLDGHTVFGVPLQIWVAALGYAVFGVGIEIVGITATKVIVRWFKGYEMAMAMGLQVGTARIGTALAFNFSAPVAKHFGPVSAPVLMGVLLLVAGLLTYLIYCGMEVKLDASEPAAQTGPADDEVFRISDIGEILSNRGWWYIAILCGLFYSAVFPWLKYAPDLMVQKFHMKETLAGNIPSLLPYACIPLTVVFGRFYDRKGKGASIMILGALLLVVAHLILALPGLKHLSFALLAAIILGFGFSLVPSAMWPSVPKFIPERQLGTAYALIFFLQNLTALMGMPMIIGWILDKWCIVGQRVAEDGGKSPAYNYTLPMLAFMASGLLAVVFGMLLKAEDKAKGYGLEEPCQK